MGLQIEQRVPALDPYLVKTDLPVGAFVVCPGGAYIHKAKHEGKDVALWLNSIGLSAFVLDYRIAPYRHPAPLSDARRAVQFVRAHAAEYNINPGKVGIIGFPQEGIWRHQRRSIRWRLIQRLLILWKG